MDQRPPHRAAGAAKRRRGPAASSSRPPNPPSAVSADALWAAVGHSHDIDSGRALSEVLETCLHSADGRQPTAGLLFAASEHDHDLVLSEVARRFPGIQIVGCTTDGEMSTEGGFTEDGLTLLLFGGGGVEIRAGVGHGVSDDPDRAAREAVRSATEGLEHPVALVLAIPDGMSPGAQAALRALDRELPEDVPVVGGMSADQVDGSKDTFVTRQFVGGAVVQDAVCVLAFAGPVAFSIGVRSGWCPLSEPKLVTRAEGALLEEVEGRPALSLFQHYLGEDVSRHFDTLSSYPLAVCEPGSAATYLRVPSSCDAETGSVTLLGEVPAGSWVQIAHAVRDDVIEGVRESAADALTTYPGGAPAFGLLFSCTGRKLVLGTRSEEEVEVARSALPDGVPLMGFYTFGEIGPILGSSRSHYHNATFVTLLVGGGEPTGV